MPDRFPARRRSRVTWAARLLTIVLAALAGSFILWDPLTIDEERHLQRIMQHSARGVRAGLAAAMRARLLSQVRRARLLKPGREVSAESVDVAELLLEHDPGIIAIQWIDRKGGPRTIIARDPEEEPRLLSVIDRLATSLPIAAALEGRPHVTSPVSLADGSRVAAIVVPVGVAPADGFLITIFDVRSSLDSILADHRAAGYSIAVIEGGQEIYRTAGAAGDLEQRWAHDGDVQLPGVVWRVRLWPGPDMIGEVTSALPELALVLGALLGFMLMATLYDARTSKVRSDELHRIREQLEIHVTERTSELQRANRALQDLSGRLLKLQDEERRRIARELHDSTTQMLAAVANNIGQARRLAADMSCGTLDVVLDESSELIDQVVAEIRTVSYLLHPPLLDELGLEYVLSWYVEGFGKRSGIDVDIDVQPGFGRLPADIELTLFRITQEALSNVHRHSGSDTGRVRLRRSGDSVELEVADDGRGLAGHLPELTQTSALGVGIAGMRERARQLGGSLEISGSERGTIVRAVLPLRAAEESAA